MIRIIMMLMGWSGGRTIRRIGKDGREEEVCKEFEETGRAVQGKKQELRRIRSKKEWRR